MRDIQELMDRLAIRELIEKYTVCVTRRDWDGMISCFLEDGRWITSVGHDLAGVAAIREGIMAAVAPRKFLMQMTHGMTIDRLDADSAETTSILHEFAVEDSIFVLGTYHDQLAKVGGEWKFRERFFQVHYMDMGAQPGQVMVDYATLR
ncbi:nuclear transport factor 2 family protein [Novosphingobium bradum]|uniref:Nuclear transport factor 2 family protein n=1 Tax=Novosphingobium bradum TaxID=1737444 RepID=A0ABV7IMH0_9SPHN